MEGLYVPPLMSMDITFTIFVFGNIGLSVIQSVILWVLFDIGLCPGGYCFCASCMLCECVCDMSGEY